MGKIDNFFKSPTEKSIVKTKIAVEYFNAWLNILKNTCNHLTYIDLFSGAGRFNDGNKSTPLQILDVVERNSDVHSKVKLYFYEEKEAHFDILYKNIKEHPVFGLLRFQPQVKLTTVDKYLIDKLPIDDCTFTFIDPYGNKDLSSDLLNASIQRWGSDCLFYLNSSGIIRNLNIPEYENVLIELFGKENITNLRQILNEKKSTIEKHKEIYRMLEGNLSKKRKLFFCEFGIEFEKKNNISHFLVFISKHKKGFDTMRQIMIKYSLCDSDTFPFFIYSSKTLKNGYQEELSLNDNKRLLVKFANWLHENFSSKEIKYSILQEQCLMSGIRYTNDLIRKTLIFLYDNNKVDIIKLKGEFKGKQILKTDLIKFKTWRQNQK